jgi:glycosyltransferase involved in cell wall biosynthesis
MKDKQRIRALLLPTTGFSQGSMYPFKHYADKLRRRFKLETTEIVSDDLKDKIEAIRQFDGDLVMFSVPWDFGTEGVLDFVMEANRVKGRARLVLFDYLDGNESRFWNVMPYVDLYLKQYLHRDMRKYQKRFLGASEFVQYQVQTGRVDNSIRSEVWTNLFQSQLDREYQHKVKLGWNFGLWQRLIHLAEGRASRVLWAKDRLDKRLVTLAREGVDRLRENASGEDKPIDVYCRATLYKGWTRTHRTEVIERLNRLEGRYRVVSSVNKVGFSEYYREMRRSKIFVSPSGWCEYTPKDYEAMYFGTVLVKPSVEHIDTHPDILRPWETYVPVRWDLEDLNKKCRHLLDNPEERLRIAGNARAAFVGYFERAEFLDRMEEILNFLGLHESSAQPELPLALAACGLTG